MNQQEALFRYLLRLGDNSLILAQRLSEWTGHGPFLEEDLALTNIALDIFGQAKSLLEYAGKVEGKGRSEDHLAFHRSEREFYNALLVEQPNGDYAKTIVRQVMMDVFDHFYYNELLKSKDETVAGIAGKSVKEITYHLRHSCAWMDRFGNGTEDSHQRAQNAIDELWRFSEDLFEVDEANELMEKAGIAPSMENIKRNWYLKMEELLATSNLKKPENNYQVKGSRNAVHSEHLGFLLAEMQHLPRMHPEAKW